MTNHIYAATPALAIGDTTTTTTRSQLSLAEFGALLLVRADGSSPPPPPSAVAATAAASGSNALALAAAAREADKAARAADAAARAAFDGALRETLDDALTDAALISRVAASVRATVVSNTPFFSARTSVSLNGVDDPRRIAVHD